VAAGYQPEAYDHAFPTRVLPGLIETACGAGAAGLAGCLVEGEIDVLLLRAPDRHLEALDGIRLGKQIIEVVGKRGRWLGGRGQGHQHEGGDQRGGRLDFNTHQAIVA
jgi:hypothetical protein